MPDNIFWLLNVDDLELGFVNKTKFMMLFA